MLVHSLRVVVVVGSAGWLVQTVGRIGTARVVLWSSSRPRCRWDIRAGDKSMQRSVARSFYCGIPDFLDLHLGGGV
jgi:hypothetical protein